MVKFKSTCKLTRTKSGRTVSKVRSGAAGSKWKTSGGRKKK